MRSHKKVQEFLEEVNEQIRYRAMCAAIDEELVAHIEDKAELYKEYGVEEEEAISRAVRDMGDASEIGIQMNAAHHVRICWPLLGMALLFMALGILGNLRNALSWDCSLGAIAEELFDSYYFLAGLAILLVVQHFGYPFMIRYVKKICAAYLIFGAAAIIWNYAWGYCYEILSEISFFITFRPPLTIYFALLLLASPVMAVFAYRQRHKGWKGLFYIFLFVAALLIVQDLVNPGDYLYMAVLALLLVFLAVLLYMNQKEYFSLPKKKACAAMILLFLVLLVSWGMGQSSWKSKNSNGETLLSRTMELFLTPEKQADTTWEDGYNGVLIQELLGKAELLGEIKLSRQELYDYAMGEWYFGEGKKGSWSEDRWNTFEENKAYLAQRIELETVTLEDVLPQHYHNNYRIAYWILKYGWLAGGLLLLAITAFCVLLIRVSFRIRNRLGRLVAFAGSICLIIQYVFYILGNFGHQFAWFGNLPFLSEGVASIAVDGVLLGVVLSAYRYDLVIEEHQME